MLFLRMLLMKLDTIRSIISEGKKVAYYIIRHNLEEKQAYLVESTLIDMLTYSPFNHNNQLTNLIAGTINGMKVLRQ